MNLIVSILSTLLLFNIVQSHEGHDHHEDPGHGHEGHDHSTMTAAANASQFDWTHQSKDLKKQVGVEFKWKADDPDWIFLQMSTKTRGYVSVGFCPEWHGTMEGCDIVIGGVDDKTGEGYLYDYYATSNIEPAKDMSQDYHLVSAEQVDWLTKITFKRRWQTEDTNDADLGKNKVQLIWSWNTEDLKRGTPIPPHDRNTRGHTMTMISLKTPPSGNHIQTSSASKINFGQFGFILILSSVALILFRN